MTSVDADLRSGRRLETVHRSESIIYKYIAIVIVRLFIIPCCHSGASIVSYIHIGNDGSIMAIPMFANVIEPAKINACYLE